MSKPSIILSEIKDLLEDDATLSEYVQGGVFIGIRESLIDYPCIILEPLRMLESDDTFPYQDLRFRVAVMLFTKIMDKDKQLVGDDSEKGILDFENDVKKVLSSDRRLDSNAIHSTFIETTYSFEEYPIRNCTIEIEVLFRQTSTTRV